MYEGDISADKWWLKMKVSIIIPVYNIEKYIERCVLSIINQSYKNIEVIIVDDGSTDRSSDIVDNYMNLDNCIVIHKENEGLSSARNVGLKAATGEFVMFVDGDDYLMNDAIEILVKKINDEIDVIIFPYIRVYGSKKIATHLFDKKEIMFSNTGVKEKLFPYLIGPSKENNNLNPGKMDRLNTAWGKLYRRSLINDIYFVDTRKIGVEDGWYNIKVFSLIKGACLYTEDTWYMYEKGNATSLLHSYKQDYCAKRWTFYQMVDDLLTEKHFTNLKQNLSNRIIMELYGIVVNEASNNKSITESSRKMNSLINKYNYDKYFGDADFKNFPLIWKVFFQLCKKRKINLLIRFIRIIWK